MAADAKAPTTLKQLAAGVDACRRCDLWRHATQGVADAARKAEAFGEFVDDLKFAWALAG